MKDHHIRQRCRKADGPRGKRCIVICLLQDILLALGGEV